MSEYVQQPDFGANQASLTTVWENTAKSLVLHAETIEPVPYEPTVGETESQPYIFRHSIDPREAMIVLGDYGVVLRSTMEYHSLHANPLDDQEAQEFVAIDWTTHESGDFVAVNRRMVIRRYANRAKQSVEGYFMERDVEYDVDKIAREQLELTDDTNTWTKRPLTDSDFDAFEKLSRQLRSQPPIYG